MVSSPYGKLTWPAEPTVSSTYGKFTRAYGKQTLWYAHLSGRPYGSPGRQTLLLAHPKVSFPSKRHSKLT